MSWAQTDDQRDVGVERWSQARTTASLTVSSNECGLGFWTSFNSALDSTIQNKKRVQENGDDSGDTKLQRLIKNGESTAQSRAQKQEFYLSFHLIILKEKRNLIKIIFFFGIKTLA